MPAWMKRKMLSMSSSTSRCSSSRKYSAIVSAAWPDAEPAARRLVHLAEHHHHVRQHAGFLHVAVKLLAFAAAFADAAENAHALLVPDHVVDHLGEQHRLAHARAAEQPRLAAALQRHEHVDDLDARLEDFGLGGTSRQRRRGSMHRAPLDIGQRRARGRWRCRTRRTCARESPLPTGAFNGPPVSSTAMPRARPCVGVSAIPRT